MEVRPLAILVSALLALTAGPGPSSGQTPPSASEKPAKALFGAKAEPAPLAARSIGGYARGCLAGAQALPVNGPTWQVMRLSRNRNWGHPHLIAFLERLATKAPDAGWPGLLVGDLAQPRGGPMLTGHASHQIGLDADIWLTPMPNRELTREERETISATSVVNAEWNDTDPGLWTSGHLAVIRLAAEDPGVERIFVNPAIKKGLCRDAGAKNRAWLRKVRPWYGHNYHFHVRMRCPDDSPECRDQDRVGDGDGCGAEVEAWIKEQALARKRPPGPPRAPLKLADLPATCRQVLVAP